MPETQSEKTILGFFTYPSIGGDDWSYAFETAQVRALEMQMLTRAAIMDMANAPDFASASASLSATEYTLGQGAGDAETEAMLRQRRAAVREQFAEWIHEGDRGLVELFKSRDDFVNLRLALRRTLTDRPVGSDYSEEGNVPPDLFAQVFEEENYEAFPAYLREATEQAVLAYYQNKEIPQIDHTIDRVQSAYRLRTARKLGSTFLLNLFQIQIDLTNMCTMLRLKFTEAEQRNVFLDGGFIELERFRHGLDVGYESLGQLFFTTPYHRLVDIGAGYVASNESFLKIEQQCEEYVTGFLRSTVTITAGTQPIVAYLLQKEQEIRTVRLILTAKRNLLDTKLILDRLT
jgi:V/A-type H+-transporting ATPase subunit C